MTTTTQGTAVAEQTITPTTLRVYNTLSKTKEPLEPVTPGHVGIYLCGPTVYDKAHIGHMVGPVIFDCIKRFLVYSGFDVTWVVNITDVDDKLIKKAQERGISMLEVAEENIADYHQNLAALGVDQIDHFPRATETMDEIVSFIESLVEQGYAYESDGDVYFEVAKDSGYGKLSNRTADSGQGEGGEMALRKRSPGDFALWKSAKTGQPSWDSSWGPGRPGWHIECSAMSRALLGEMFDIHGGGLDLVFPHHENEIAQSECCHSKPMVKYWMHNGLLRAGAASGKLGGRSDRENSEQENSEQENETSRDEQVSGKMSRSKGAGGLADLLERQGGERIRFFLLRTHYRSTVLFTEEAIEEAGTGLDTFYRLFKRYQRVTGDDFYAFEAPTKRVQGAIEMGTKVDTEAGDDTLQAAAGHRDRFLAAMDDDFNTGMAIAELFELAHVINKFADAADLEAVGKTDKQAVAQFTCLMVTLKELSSTLGLFQKPPATDAVANPESLDTVMQLVIELRAAARANKDFATADRIRDALADLDITLEDRAGGTEWSDGSGDLLAGIMRLVIDIRAAARENKDFPTADKIRDALAAAGITLEDRSGGTDWTIQ